MKYTHILFDLDGTLTDPKEGITKSIQYALAKFNIKEDNLDKLEPFIGPPLVNSFMEFYSFTELEAKQAVEYYREYFKDKGMYENKLYPGMKELLQQLTDQNRSLMVATSKPTYFAQKILEYFDIAPYFDYVCGSNLDGTRVDKTEIIGFLMDEKKLEKHTAIMIGDRKFDIIGAQHNGIASIGVGYGYGSELELRNANPTTYFNTVQELTMFFQHS